MKGFSVLTFVMAVVITVGFSLPFLSQSTYGYAPPQTEEFNQISEKDVEETEDMADTDEEEEVEDGDTEVDEDVIEDTEEPTEEDLNDERTQY